MINRRKFLIGAGLVTLAAPLAAGAQQSGKIYRIGWPEVGSAPSPRRAVFLEALRELGWIDGQNIRIDYRCCAASKPSKLVVTP